jgi:hypothetical protein
MVEGGKAKKTKMTETEFWSVKDKKKIGVNPEDIKVQKKQMKNGRTSYMLRAEKDGRKLVKFVNEVTYKKFC